MAATRNSFHDNGLFDTFTLRTLDRISSVYAAEG
jgi:hypothetical protein